MNFEQYKRNTKKQPITVDLFYTLYLIIKPETKKINQNKEFCQIICLDA